MPADFVFRCFFPAFLATISFTSLGFAENTIVRFDSSVGIIDIELFDDVAPRTVGNFLDYVSEQSYDSSIFHRSVPGFVLQGGGFYSNTESVLNFGSIENEFRVSNTRGTIAMAKLGGNPDSATSQWFINLSDNSATLDVQNGGFSVFGAVTDESMAIIDNIQGLRIANLSSQNLNWRTVPILDTSTATSPDMITADDLVVIRSISVVPEPTIGIQLLFAFGGLMLMRPTRMFIRRTP